MKLITAVIKPDRLDDVIRAAAENGARGLTATEVMGFGQQFGHVAAVAPREQSALVLPKVRIDVLTSDELAGSLADTIAKTVNTGSIGDGKIWISPVEDALRVRTGERGNDAV
jgi:nitrogen regulatory protein PII